MPNSSATQTHTVGPARWILIVPWSAIFLAAQTVGTINGVVIDPDGNPVPDARVRLADAPVRAMNIEKTTPTGTDGKFVIGNVKWGTYTLQAMKPEEGYPDPFVLMYRYHVVQPTATVSPAQPVADIVVPIGPKAGQLRISIADAATGKELDSATMTLVRRDDEFVKTSIPVAGAPVLVPAETLLVIAIHVDGYSDWYYPGRTVRGLAEPISLGSGEQKTLRVRLQPLPPK